MWKGFDSGAQTHLPASAVDTENEPGTPADLGLLAGLLMPPLPATFPTTPLPQRAVPPGCHPHLKISPLSVRTEGRVRERHGGVRPVGDHVESHQGTGAPQNWVGTVQVGGARAG